MPPLELDLHLHLAAGSNDGMSSRNNINLASVLKSTLAR